MEEYEYLLQLAIILLSTKVLGIVSKRFALPQVVGALLAGLFLGPAFLGLLGETEFLNAIAELGVIVLMFSAGLETDLSELKRSGKAASVIALLGVLLPLLGGFALTSFFNQGSENLLQNVFIGVILTATSVSITVETLREIGKLSTKSGSTILGAALIDDVLSIVVLTVVTSLNDSDVSIPIVLLKIVGFFVFAGVSGILLNLGIRRWFNHYNRDKRRFVVIAFALCLVFAYVAEAVFGVADITGAYVAGLIFSKTPRVTFLEDRFDTMSYLILSPVFFASIGLKVVLPEMTSSIILFSVLLIIVAMATKVIGCSLGAKICGYQNQDAIRIGVGMISRGEVALIVVNKGVSSGLMNQDYFGPIVLMVIVTTVLTPIFLKMVYKGSEKDYSQMVESPLVERFEDAEFFHMATQALLEDHESLKNQEYE